MVSIVTSIRCHLVCHVKDDVMTSIVTSMATLISASGEDVWWRGLMTLLWRRW